jgi:hypothetical protein
MKKILITLLIIVGAGAIVYGGYILSQKPGAPAATPEPTGGLPSPQSVSGGSGAVQQTQLPPAVVPSANTPAGILTSAAFGVIAQNPVTDYFVDSGNNAYFIQPDGQVFAAMNGSLSTLNGSAMQDMLSASFSYDGTKILASFGSSFSPQWSIFDIKAKTWSPLPIAMYSAAWSPNDLRIAYFTKSGDLNAATILDTNNPKAKPVVIIKLRAQDLTLNWMSSSTLILAERSSGLVPASAWAVSISKKTLLPLEQDIFGLRINWPGSSAQGLVFSGKASNRGGALSIVDPKGSALHGLSFLTLPSKCTFGFGKPVGTSTAPLPALLFCGAPRDQDVLSRTLLPDAYDQKQLMTADDLYSINLADGTVQSLFADQSQILDGTNLKTANGRLFFVNRYDNRLYGITL